MKIGVFFGGKSPEHDVSIITGELVISELRKMGYNVIPVYLGKDNQWYIDEKLGRLKFFQEKNKGEMLKSFEKFNLDLSQSRKKLVFKKKRLISSRNISIELAFPAFHGSNGEDGTIQGMFEFFNIPYVGCDVASSVIAFDKILTKKCYQSNNILTTKFIHFNKNDWQGKKEEILSDIKKNLSYPLFIKPPKLGSSIGISKAIDDKKLEFGIEVAFHYGENVLIEEAVENLMDVTCCLIGNEHPQASLLQEAVFQNDLFDFEEKYLKDGGAQLGNSQSGIVIPARLDSETAKNIQEMAKNIYKIVGCSGIARVDFLYDKESKKIYANEINPMPGTIYHHLWKASGMELNELLKNLIDFAKERYESKNKIRYAFETDILKKANSIKLKMKK
jgi:D-alanine-D-alanine ligase